MIRSESILQRILFQSLRSFRSFIVLILKPLGKSRRDFFEAFLYGVVRPIWNLLPDASNFAITATFNDNLIRFRPFVLHDFLFVLANANRNHEPLVQEVFQPRQGQIFVDVGAHIGLYTLRAAEEVGLAGRVIAVEPDPQSYRILKNNIALNHFNNVLAFNVALSDSSGEKTFYACTDPSLSGFELQPTAKLREVRTVKVMTLDELLAAAGVGHVDWVKLDVEGAETGILRGGKNVLMNSKNLKVIVESSSDEAIKYLKTLGFKTRFLGEIYYFAEKIS